MPTPRLGVLCVDKVTSLRPERSVALAPNLVMSQDAFTQSGSGAGILPILDPDRIANLNGYPNGRDPR